jgi:hypothetical protein
MKGSCHDGGRADTFCYGRDQELSESASGLCRYAGRHTQLVDTLAGYRRISIITAALQRLEEQGFLEQKKIGSRTLAPKKKLMNHCISCIAVAMTVSCIAVNASAQSSQFNIRIEKKLATTRCWRITMV